MLASKNAVMHRPMLKRRLFFAVAMIASFTAPAYAQDGDFQTWLAGVKAEAISKGISANIADEALSQIEFDDSVIALDQKQPEDKATFTQYLRGALNKKRIARGKELMKEHHALLKKISAYYHVQPQYIVALWGIESDYGDHQGSYSVVQSLATLAYEGRRAEFFRSELLKALQIMAQYHVSFGELTGSWAGAMGNCQFMPSSYLNFAVDWNKDGKPDIWETESDTFASIANYLQQSGWDDKVGWGEAADANDSRELITPGLPDEGMFAVTDNYKVLLKWNRSRMFAVAVGLLADELASR